jgi:hypothetical protein
VFDRVRDARENELYSRFASKVFRILRGCFISERTKTQEYFRIPSILDASGAEKDRKGRDGFEANRLYMQRILAVVRLCRSQL